MSKFTQIFRQIIIPRFLELTKKLLITTLNLPGTRLRTDQRWGLPYTLLKIYKRWGLPGKGFMIKILSRPTHGRWLPSKNLLIYLIRLEGVIIEPPCAQSTPSQNSFFSQPQTNEHLFILFYFLIIRLYIYLVKLLGSEL